jgi:hypothetical protein
VKNGNEYAISLSLPSCLWSEIVPNTACFTGSNDVSIKPINVRTTGASENALLLRFQGYYFIT